MINIIEKVQCCGCYACSNICPKWCITMNVDAEGFWYPEINKSNCVNCNLCETVCPVLNKKRIENNPIAYAAYNRDQAVRLKSSSGGIFSLIAEIVINQGGVVFGACFDRDFNVVHDYAETIEDVSKFRGSKYVQSKIGDTYKTVKSFLNEGRLVLFTGTPCQIGGLKTYLQKDYVNLICQDIVCHGVPSPRIWRKYVEFREAEAASQTRRMFFRSKKYGWKTYSVLFEFSNSTEYVKILSEDFYMRGFLANLYLRPSCYHCNFKSMHRESDITLADFWGIENILPKMDDDMGTSLVLVNSEKGKYIFEKIKENVVFKKTDLNEAMMYNSSMVKSVEINSKRELFLREINSLDFDKAIKKYLTVGVLAKCKKSVYKMLSKIRHLM